MPGTSARADEPTDTTTPTTTPTTTTTTTTTPLTEPAQPEMDPAAKGHYARGLELYAAHNYTAAVAELEKGFAIDPRREFLFAEAQALRLAGACAQAVPLYRRFLETDPSPLQIQAARLGLDRCAPDRATSVPASSAPPVRTPAGGPAPAPVPAPDRPIWWHDWLATSSLGAGVVALGFGTGFVIASNQARDEANSTRTTTLSSFARLWETAQQRRAIGVTLLGAGAMLLGAGTVRLIFLHRRERAGESAHARLSLLPTSGGGTLMWETRF